MENRNNQHPDADQGSGQQQPDPLVPNPIVPNVLILRLPVPTNQWNLTIPLILEYRYTVVFPYGSGYYYYHYFHCYDGGAVLWPTFPAPFPPVENVNDPNIRHHNPPRLEPLPEDVTFIFFTLATSPLVFKIFLLVISYALEMD